MEFQRRGIETLEAEADGSFDYIDLSGVVNHVEDPAKILAFLSHVLAEPGGIGVMAYGRLGRTGIYPIQDALARLGLTTKDDIPAARALLRTLPETNWLRRNPILADSDKVSDVEFADRFFNPRDRAFSVRDLGQLFGGAGFELRAFLPPIVYDSRAILSGEDLRRRAGSLSRLEQWHLAEQLQGSLNKHTFYAIRPKGPSQGQIDYTEPDYRAVIQGPSRRHLASALKGPESKRISIAFDHESRQRSMSLDLSVLEVEILGRLNDGDRFGEIRERFPRLEPLVVNAAIERVCRALTAVGVLHLEISPYRT
jgi:hypothetical protein